MNSDFSPSNTTTLVSKYENESINVNVTYSSSLGTAVKNMYMVVNTQTPLVLSSSYQSGRLDIKCSNLYGLFPVDIQYKNMDEDKLYNVTKFDDVPNGTNYQIISYVAPSTTSKIIDVNIVVELADNTTEVAPYKIEIMTNLDTNLQLFQNKIKSNTKVQ